MTAAARTLLIIYTQAHRGRIYKHTHTHKQMHARALAHRQVHVYAHALTHTQHTHTHALSHTHPCVHTHLRADFPPRMCLPIQNTHTLTHIHTHLRTQIPPGTCALISAETLSSFGPSAPIGDCGAEAYEAGVREARHLQQEAQEDHARACVCMYVCVCERGPRTCVLWHCFDVCA